MHVDLISNIFLGRYASRTVKNETFDMVQSYKSSRDFRVGPGSGLSLSKYFGSAYKTFCNIKSNDFFLS